MAKEAGIAQTTFQKPGFIEGALREPNGDK